MIFCFWYTINSGNMRKVYLIYRKEKNMSNKLDLKMFLDGYANVAKKAEKLGHEDLDGRKTELNDQIKFAEKKISEMKNMGHKEFEQKSKIYMEIIKNGEKEIQDIDKEKDERKKNPEKDQEIKDMYQAKSNIIENAQDAYNKAKSENENEIENIKKELDDKKAEKAQRENELKEMLDLEKKDPSRAKDSHYKEFLNKKIEALNTEIKALEPSVKKQIVQKEKEKQEINAEYRRFLLNVGKIDRNEELIPMAADIRKQDEAEKQKAGGMDEFDKYDFIQRAKKAERFNVGMQMGEFKPTFLSKIVAKIKGINIKKLAEKNESVEIENASAVNVALDKKDDEAKDFIKGLRVDEKTNLGKNLENTELDESQLSEIKNVYAHQKNDQMRTSNSGEER